ncbi:MAG TPA: aminotransferase class V-fold PLP-dependent enzyme [Xanthobacteraceae bacterium]|jgi:isopenicillin-N epimerase|nr:aminotransferase class V-fold PLP-dependent enzyme [Xanthobacteraceae bacterium]
MTKFPRVLSREEWGFDPEFTFLNHGSFGAAPLAVLAEQERWRAQMERHPTGFMAYVLPDALRKAAARLADFVGAQGNDVVFVENTTAGCNAVLNSLSFLPGDEILVTNHGYPAVRKAAQHIAARTGAVIVEAEVPFPISDASQILDPVKSCLTRRTRLAIFDHITSPTAIIFPVRELAELSHNMGAKVLIDGAHAPGMLALDMPAINADWYVGNCHKWLMVPKGCAFLWAQANNQADLHPLVISHGYGQGFVAEFDWVGTRDASGWLSVPAALDFHARLGGAALRERNRKLAISAANKIAEIWKTQRGTPDALTGSMATIELSTNGPATQEHAIALRKWLFEDQRIEVQANAFANALWIRISAQAYNEDADYERLITAIQKHLKH